MDRGYLFFIFIFISITCSYAQSKLPYPINTEFKEELATLLPDSSIILVSSREGSSKFYRFVYGEDEWISQPNSLTDHMNSLILQDNSLVWRLEFSADFTHCFVNLMQFKKNWNYESIMTSGEWSVFRQIIEGVNSSDYNQALSYGLDNNSIYSRGYSDSYNTPNIFQSTKNRNGWEISDTVNLAHFNIDFSDEVISVGDGLLVLASWKPNKRFKC